MNPRGIYRAPGRVNLIGEHTDYNEGFVIPAAIDFYSYAAIGERADGILSIYSEQFQEAAEFRLDQLTGAPRKHWSDYIRGVAAVLQGEGYQLKGLQVAEFRHAPAEVAPLHGIRAKAQCSLVRGQCFFIPPQPA